MSRAAEDKCIDRIDKSDEVSLVVQDGPIFVTEHLEKTWMVLTNDSLSLWKKYGAARSNHRVIPTSSIVLIEEVSFIIEGGSLFQVMYEMEELCFTLHIFVESNEKRDEWISAFREVCRLNKNFLIRYHAGIWNGNIWSCCSTNNSNGCRSSWGSKMTTPSKPAAAAATSDSSPHSPNDASDESIQLIIEDIDTSSPRQHSESPQEDHLEIIEKAQDEAENASDESIQLIIEDINTSSPRQHSESPQEDHLEIIEKAQDEAEKTLSCDGDMEMSDEDRLALEMERALMEANEPDNVIVIMPEDGNSEFIFAGYIDSENFEKK